MHPNTNVGIDTSDNEGRCLVDWTTVATDLFIGQEGKIAEYNDGWTFIEPTIGFAVAVRDKENSIYVCQTEAPIFWDISGYFYEEIIANVHYVKHRHPNGETAIVSSVIL